MAYEKVAKQILKPSNYKKIHHHNSKESDFTVFQITLNQNLINIINWVQPCMMPSEKDSEHEVITRTLKRAKHFLNNWGMV